VPRLRYLPAARRDLRDIYRYVAEASGSAEIARRFTDAIERKCKELASLPGTLGRQRPELRPDLRSAVHRGYVIFFRYAGDRFEVVNVLEGHRDIDSHVAEDR
jgi:plasmid stabilization system protein ParE